MLVAGKIVGAIFVAAALSMPASAQEQADHSCPMPLAAQVKSIRAFRPIHEFVMNEPRCVNCHGGVNPHVQGVGRDPVDEFEVPSVVEHEGGVIPHMPPDRTTGRPVLDSANCMGCHDGMAKKRDGSDSRWFTAPPFLAFLDKDAPTLCRQFKRASSFNAEHFIGHLIDDNGGEAFTKTAFAGNRGIDGLAPKPPRISHAALIRLGGEWIDAMGGEFKGGEACGCEIEKVKVKFTSKDHSPVDDITISGDMIWRKEESAVGIPQPGAPLVLKPKSGEITIHYKAASPGIPVGRCEADDRRTFNVADLGRGALRFMKLEIEEDLTYRVSLAIPDYPDPFPTWTLNWNCTGPGVSHTAPSQVKNQSMIIGKQTGTIDAERDITGELPAPIRHGVRTITGNWTFKADEN